MPDSNAYPRTRAGRPIRQAEGYAAFIPEPLPPQPPIIMDGELQELLSAADQALGRLDGSTDRLPDQDLFVFMYMRREAVLSSQIEGTQASLSDILEAEAEIFDSSAPTDVAEVVRYVEAMNYGLERLQQLPVSLRLMTEIHQRLMRGVRGAEKRPGEFRTSQNWIGPGGSTLATASFVPSPPSQVLEHLGALEKFVHDPEPMPVLLKVGLVHAQFETIHPFLDGNGRIGRLLITFLLCERKALSRPLLYLSHHFKKNQTEYYDRLQAIRTKGDWENWLKFFLQGVALVATEAADKVKQIDQLRQAHRATVSKHFGRNTPRALVFLEKLYRRPTVTVNSVKDDLGITFANANKLVANFVEHKILEEVSQRPRNRQFTNSAYLDLFKD